MTDAGPIKAYPAACPYIVTRPAMLQRWDRLTFLHWKFDIETVKALLPAGLEVEPFDGYAWVGLVPFFMEVSLPRSGGIPWLFNFPETNVRTYVRGPSGDPGVWFFSLDAARLAAVITARTTYRVAYFWSKMDVWRQGNSMRYSTRRRWPGPRGTESRVELEIGDEYSSTELTDFDHYLTARWTLYGTRGGRLLMARAQHTPWPLHRVRLLSCHDGLLQAAGLPTPTAEPIVHWSPGVDVRVGYPWFTS